MENVILVSKYPFYWIDFSYGLVFSGLCFFFPFPGFPLSFQFLTFGFNLIENFLFPLPFSFLGFGN